MKKLIVAAVVLGLAGVAAAGAIGVHRLANGQCPLTGGPITGWHCSGTTRSAAAAAPIGLAGDAVASPSTEATEEPVARRHCCCPKKAAQQEEATRCEKPVQAPVQPTQNP